MEASTLGGRLGAEFPASPTWLGLAIFGREARVGELATFYLVS